MATFIPDKRVKSGYTYFDYLEGIKKRLSVSCIDTHTPPTPLMLFPLRKTRHLIKSQMLTLHHSEEWYSAIFRLTIGVQVRTFNGVCTNSW